MHYVQTVQTNNISSELNLQSNVAHDRVDPCHSYCFAVAIVRLVLALCQTTQLIGIFHKGPEHRVSLYADDILIYLSNPSH